ncbi:hypothetical protein V8F06_001580 [Rhypophila decipiens]
MLSNGFSISPLRNSQETRSLRECIQAIDNDKDLGRLWGRMLSGDPNRASCGTKREMQGTACSTHALPSYSRPSSPRS